MSVTVYEARDATKPEHRFVALIDYDGFQGRSPHLCSFSRAPTYEDARRRGEDFETATKNPTKKHRTPTDSATLREADLDASEPI